MSRKQLLLSLAVFTTFIGIHAMEDVSNKAFIPQSYGNISVLHDKKGFAVSDGYTSQRVQNAFVDKEMRGLSNEKLAKYLTANYVRVSKADDGEYVLRSSGRLNGSGPVLAGILYAGTWVVGATTSLVVAGATVVAAVPGGPAAVIAVLPAAGSVMIKGAAITETAANGAGALGMVCPWF